MFFELYVSVVLTIIMINSTLQCLSFEYHEPISDDAKNMFI